MPRQHNAPYSNSNVNWAKLRQELIKEYGERWYMNEFYAQRTLLSICLIDQSGYGERGGMGLLIAKSERLDAEFINKIKKGLIDLSINNESIYIDCNVGDNTTWNKFYGISEYRDSVLNDALIKNSVHCINILTATGPNIYYEGNIRRWPEIKWTTFMEYEYTDILFLEKTIEEEYLRECRRQRVEPVMDMKDYRCLTDEGIELLFIVNKVSICAK